MLAVWNEDDQWHPAAIEAFSHLEGGRTAIITWDGVLWECANAAVRTGFRNDVLALRTQLVVAGKLIEPTPLEADEAWRQYARFGAAGAGMIDLISMELMRREKCDAVFSNDRHFHAAGVETLF